MWEIWLEQISPCIRPQFPGHPRRSMYTHHEVTRPGWVEPLRVIYDHELVIFKEGEYVVEIEGEEYDCPAGSFIIILPGRFHVSYDSANQVGHRYWCHFDWVYRGPYGRTPVITHHPGQPEWELMRTAPDFVPDQILHGPIPEPDRAYELVEQLCARWRHGGDRDRLVARGLLLELLLEVLSSADQTAHKAGREEELAHRVRQHIEHAVNTRSELPPMRQLLQELGYSYEHLCRIFLSKYGISPLKYVHAIRISRAKVLVRNTNLNVSEIAYRVGFGDPSYFSRLFRVMTGMSPSEFADNTPRTG